MTGPGEPDAYQRGVKAGKIDEELAGHGRRLDKINGSMERIADRLGSIDARFSAISMALQQIKDQMAANDVTVEATAKALESAAKAQRQATEKRWQPWQKTLALTAVLVAIVGLAFAILTRP